jgi:hypothetical protein
MNPDRKRLPALGIAAVAFYAAHATTYLLRRQPENLLWVCHLGALAVGVGLIAGWPTWNAVGAFWLVLGVPLWIYDLSRGGEFIATSTLTHGGGLAVGAFGLRRIGLPRGAWWKATAALAGANLLCRAVTPPGENVNLAHAVYRGWESAFPSHFVYLVCLLALFAAVAWALQFGLPKLGFPVRP